MSNSQLLYKLYNFMNLITSSNDESSLLVQSYYSNTAYRGQPESFAVFATQGNSICGDSITVYLQIQDKKVTDYRYDGEASPITAAAAAFLGEFIIGEQIKTILTWDGAWIKNEGFEVSHKRRRSSISALLAAKNALHAYLQDGIQEGYEELL